MWKLFQFTNFLLTFLNLPNKTKILFNNACLKNKIQQKYTKNTYIWLKGSILLFLKVFQSRCFVLIRNLHEQKKLSQLQNLSV